MPVHHGGKVGNAAKTLAKKNSSKKSKSKAGTILADHKAKKAQIIKSALDCKLQSRAFLPRKKLIPS